MGMGFKDLIRKDNADVFINVDEFGEPHVVGGRKMPVIIDGNEMIEREKRQSGPESYRQGVYREQVLFYVRAGDFGKLPAVGRSIMFDGEQYLVTDAVDEGGIYSISLEGMRS